MKTKIHEELMEEMGKETDLMRLEMRKENDRIRQEFLSQQLCVEPIEPLVSPTPKSTKGSCAAPPTSGDDIIGQTKDCELLVVGGKLPLVVALGKVYQDATTLHNVLLSPDVAKVTVEKVRFPDARVPLPSDEVTTVADAFQTFVAWPRDLIRFMPEPHKPFRAPSPEKKRDVPVDNPIASLRLIASQIGNEPFAVPWDDTFFQINTELSLMMYNTDLLEFVSGNQKLNINIIQFFMM
ncbi:uncharacterized protein [Phaseolus vulgaris]|uniref:uncharacterized protein n=1 Tax=Phaseolus vulgaris TaxID=3885 RepID=UPI0035C9C6E9